MSTYVFQRMKLKYFFYKQSLEITMFVSKLPAWIVYIICNINMTKHVQITNLFILQAFSHFSKAGQD